ncbi:MULTISPECIES: hypothetical protein [Micromonospora]|nr:MULTISPECIES: hypothetical protein [Micromonospora]ADU09820.1 beta propeller domain protein [Micromonospora sp. L5]MBC9004553.1 hypothetical protein [Micromonospora aurantiaca]MDG4752512.1 hypothetical protein [Micromonospora sp. WMMD718]SCL43526.1 hypothetical protein GA0070615_6559 [Micromonospora aurantiaca]
MSSLGSPTGTALAGAGRAAANDAASAALRAAGTSAEPLSRLGSSLVPTP